MTRVYIALGSNLAQPLQQVEQGWQALSALPLTRAVARSPWYQSVAVGPVQPDYINGVAALDTELAALDLLDALQAIELSQGRERKEHWGPRTLDLDLLLFGNEEIQHPRLTVPHPRIGQRNFVLQPLLDLDPNLQLPNAVSVAALLAQCGTENLRSLSDAAGAIDV